MSVPRKILFVTPHYPPSPSVGTQRMVRFIKYLARHGWQVYVLTQKESYYPPQSIISANGIPEENVHVIRTGKLDPFRVWAQVKSLLKKKGSTPVAETPRQSKNPGKTPATSPPKPATKKRSVVYRFIDFITRMMQYPDRENGWIGSVLWHTWRLLRTENIPFVLASSPPHSPYLVLNFLRSIRRFTYVVDFRDPWARSQWSKETRHLHEKISRQLDIWFEQRTLKRADIVLFNNQVLYEEYQQCYPHFHLENKSLVLTNGFDAENVDAQTLLAPRQTRGEQEIVIIHAGTLYKKRDPRNIFEALIQIKQENPEQARRIRLKFLGHVTPDLRYLYTFVKEQGIDDLVQFLPPKPYEAALQEMAAADWLLILQPVTRIQVPAKFFDYLIIPRPIWGVVEPDSISERLIRELHVGQVSYNNDKTSLLEFFRYILTEPRPAFQPDAERLQHYMVENIVQRLENVLLGQPQNREVVVEH